MTADWMTMLSNRITVALAANTYRFATEDELQRGIAAALTNAEIPFEREVRLGLPDRIDFLCGDVGIEVKIGGGISALTRQLSRYADSERIAALVVVTSRNQHRVQLPRRINDKPIAVVVVGGIA